MRHIVNFGLLACFVTLAVSGLLAYARPFSLVTTRVHLVFGVATLILVGLHLASRLPYFKSQFSRKSSRSPVPRPLLIAIMAAWIGLLWAAIGNWAPIDQFVRQSYESRHRQAIVRASTLTGFAETSATHRLVARRPGKDVDAEKQPDVGIALSIGLGNAIDLEHQEKRPAFAVWAESTTGAMIETLYIDPTLAYSDLPIWGGQETPRHHVLPLWRHRYSMVSGIDPTGQVDAVSGATDSHRFSLDHYLVLDDASSFVLCVEINAPGDPNEAFDDPHLGQPSLLYTAYIELGNENPYVLLELTGHGGAAEKSGAIHYDLDGFTTAKSLIDLLLAKVEPAAMERDQ